MSGGGAGTLWTQLPLFQMELVSLYGLAVLALCGAPIDPHFIPLAQLAPGRFLSNPSVWVGLMVAAALLAAAVRLRRYREPI
jgi:hypothetical protein